MHVANPLRELCVCLFLSLRWVYQLLFIMPVEAIHYIESRQTRYIGIKLWGKPRITVPHQLLRQSLGNRKRFEISYREYLQNDAGSSSTPLNEVLLRSIDNIMKLLA